MFDYANAVAQADMLVIAAPYWDMSFPSSLKIFFEAASVEAVPAAGMPAPKAPHPESADLQEACLWTASRS